MDDAELRSRLSKLMHNNPPVPFVVPEGASSPECVVSKVETQGVEHAFDIHQFRDGQFHDTIHVTRWQQGPVTDEDLSQSIRLSEMVSKMFEMRRAAIVSRESALTATELCQQTREAELEYRTRCNQIAEHLVEDLKNNTEGIATLTVKQIFGPVGYTFFRDLAYSHHPEIPQTRLQDILQQLSGDVSAAEGGDTT
ncbi:hypothetical protein [uncultured Duncaniella sp.]|uniref:hypothetical protein n=1 Tax=uncultured Duncaniella sp. TaxID=2768039 RepID=UPI00261B163F|nr:hypothetical protein [uncultured Duncaniella sp.]